MILFVGEQDKGWFVPETAEKKNEKCEYSGFVSSLEELSKRILQGSFSAVILHLPSLVIMDYQNIGKFCKNLMIANGNIQIIVMAEGYNINSQIVQAAIAAGVRFFMLGTNASMLKNELTDALDGKTNIETVFEQLPTEDQRDRKKNEIESSFASSRTIAVAGSQHRIGTTTQALQIVKHLILEGHTACYIQLNSSDYVQKVGEFYTDAILNEDTGLVTYQNLEMYYKQERIADILAENYDYYIYDFGCISDKEFTLVQFLEKDTRIAVCGSKANELPYIQSVLELINTSTAEYIFSFTGEADRKDISELMEDKQKHTFFSGYIPDPFSYNPSSKEIYSAIIKPEKTAETETTKNRFRLFGRRKKVSVKSASSLSPNSERV